MKSFNLKLFNSDFLLHATKGPDWSNLSVIWCLHLKRGVKCLSLERVRMIGLQIHGCPGRKAVAGRGSLTSYQIAGSYSVSRFSLFCKKSHQVINSLPPFLQKCPSVPLRQHTSNLVWFQLSLQLRNWEEKWKPDPLECDNAYSQEFCRRSWPHSGLWCWIRWSGSTQSVSMLNLWPAKASDKWGAKYVRGEKNILQVAKRFLIVLQLRLV